MPMRVHIDEQFSVGEALFSSVSPRSDWAVVFEDDGVTGYFYATAWDPGAEGRFGKVYGALHIYNVVNVSDRDKASRLQIGWSEDGAATVLLINSYPHAVFDRNSNRAMCRTGFPPPARSSLFNLSEKWDSSVIDQFR